MARINENTDRLVLESDLYKERKEEFVREHNMEWVVIHKKDIAGF